MKKIIDHQGIKHEISESYYNYLKKWDKNSLDKYFSFLLEHESPIHKLGLDYLIACDLTNTKYLGEQKLLGHVVKYDKMNNIIGHFDTIYDAVMDSLDNKCKYGFENLHNMGFVPNKQKQKFFGVEINVDYTIPIMKELNALITRCKNRYFDKSKMFRNFYNEYCCDKMSFDDFKMKRIKSWTFSFLLEGSFLINDVMNNKFCKEEIYSVDYKECLNDLLSRYSVKNKSSFIEINNLKSINYETGIYVLCLENGCYVGQTERDLKTRIVQHFTNPNSNFDRMYRPQNVKKIYVLPLGETSAFIDAIESDCIAILGKDSCLNVLAGGSSIELIKSENYNPQNYMLKKDLVNWVSQDSYNLVEYLEDMENIKKTST